MVRFSRLLGFKDPSSGAIRIASIMLLLGSAWSIAFQISTTFWMIHIAASLGGGDFLLGMGLVGILIVIRIAVQTLLDYPTGGIGDWIGQRYIIASALLCYALAFWLTSISGIGTPFFVFVIIYVLMGLGASQESGAMGAWFDNNYRIAMPQDKDRKEYGVFWARAGMLFQLVSTLVLIPGSFLALILQRTWVFQIQAVFFVALAIMAMILIQDMPGARQKSEYSGFRQYGRLLKDGIKFVGSSKFVTFTMIGEMLMWSIGICWWEILLFPLYFSYLLTDIGVSTFRTSMFAPMVVAAERSGVISKRFDPKKWIPRLRIIQFCGFTFFMALMAITTIFPPPDLATATFITAFIPFTAIPYMTLPFLSVIPILLIWIVFVSSDVIGRITDVLNGRVMLDVFPNRIRNCMYSLRPTIAMLLSVPLILLISNLLPIVRFPIVFILCAIVAGIGALLVRKGFNYPIPRDESIEEQLGVLDDEEPLVPSEEIGEIPIPTIVDVPVQRQSKAEELLE
ncbi:MAG: hypothetical protein ACFE89_04445 [Candidatus Hodarchaeota archaeon]